MPLDAYKETLHRVAPEFNGGRGDENAPWHSFDFYEAIGPHATRYIEQRYVYPEGSPLPPMNKVAQNLPLKAFARLSFDQLCKVRHSSLIMMDRSVCDHFEKESPEHMLVHKIESSMWRWGYGRGAWNDIVDAHEGIRNFDLGLEGFEVRLDHTAYVNECGYSEHSRTYLDGVFAYLIYYKGEHVMTLGFSIMGDRRIPIQQVQLAKRRGNRFLFRMPTNRVEFFIQRFREAFPGHKLYIVDGADVGNKSLRSYRAGLERAKDCLARAEAQRERQGYTIDRWTNRDIYYSREEIAILTAKIEHLEGEIERLRAFYADTGRFRRYRKPLTCNSLNHYPLAA